MFIMTQPVSVTFMICWPYDASRKKLATLSLFVVMTCCACAKVSAGRPVLLKFAMMTNTLRVATAFATALSVFASVDDTGPRIVIRSGVIDSLSASIRPCTRTFIPGSSGGGSDPIRRRRALPDASCTS